MNSSASVSVDADTGSDTHTSVEQPASGTPRVSRRADPAWQAFALLRTVFTVAPIVLGADKFLNVLVDWSIYLTPHVLVIPETQAMYVVGVIEIVAGLVVALAPRWGAPLVAAWLAGIIGNLVVLGDYWDIAFRDFGLLIGALALWRLAVVYAPSRRKASPASVAR